MMTFLSLLKGKDMLSLEYTSNDLSFEQLWYPNMRRTECSKPNFEHMLNKVLLHECVAIRTAAPSDTFNKARSHSPAELTGKGVLDHEPSAIGEVIKGVPLSHFKPALSLSSSHVKTQLGSEKPRVGTAIGRCLVLRSNVIEVFVLSASHSRKPSRSVPTVMTSSFMLEI